MKLSIRNGMIWDLDLNKVIGATTDECTPEHERAIQMGSEAIPVIETFVEEVNTGTFKPRAAVKEFEMLLIRYPKAS